jgi:hypothetical protein
MSTSVTLGGVVGLLCSADRIEHNLGICRLRESLGHFVAVIALVWVVATKFL